MRERGVVTRRRTLSSGRVFGGIPFTKGPLAHLLKNRMYLGEINHGRMSYPGEHPAIIDRTLFDAAQAILARNATARGHSQSRSDALLLGKLFDDRGLRMTPSFAVKRGVRYRYYVSRAVTEGRNDLVASLVRVPAVDVEEAVLEAVRKLPGIADGNRWSSLDDNAGRKDRQFIHHRFVEGKARRRADACLVRISDACARRAGSPIAPALLGCALSDDAARVPHARVRWVPWDGVGARKPSTDRDRRRACRHARRFDWDRAHA